MSRCWRHHQLWSMTSPLSVYSMSLKKHCLIINTSQNNNDNKNHTNKQRYTVPLHLHFNLSLWLLCILLQVGIVYFKKFKYCIDVNAVYRNETCCINVHCAGNLFNISSQSNQSKCSTVMDNHGTWFCPFLSSHLKVNCKLCSPVKVVSGDVLVMVNVVSVRSVAVPNKTTKTIK